MGKCNERVGDPCGELICFLRDFYFLNSCRRWEHLVDDVYLIKQDVEGISSQNDGEGKHCTCLFS